MLYIYIYIYVYVQRRAEIIRFPCKCHWCCCVLVNVCMSLCDLSCSKFHGLVDIEYSSGNKDRHLLSVKDFCFEKYDR